MTIPDFSAIRLAPTSKKRKKEKKIEDKKGKEVEGEKKSQHASGRKMRWRDDKRHQGREPCEDV